MIYDPDTAQRRADRLAQWRSQFLDGLMTTMRYRQKLEGDGYSTEMIEEIIREASSVKS